jgi:hypothetical protein
VPSAESQPRDRAYYREMFSTVLLSLATVASTWSAYQSARWSGAQATHFSDAARTRTQSEGRLSTAAQKTAFDATMFIAFASAFTREDAPLERFLYQRFRPEMKAALDAWLATRPLQNPSAPPTPLAMKEYVVADRREAQQLGAEADHWFEEAKKDNQTADEYVLISVLLTSVMFFAGVGGKTWGRSTTRVLLGLGLATFVVAAALLLHLPVL